MAIVKKEIDYAQEIGDVGLAAENLIRRIRAKEPIGDLMSKGLPELYAAVDKAGEIDDEVGIDRAVALRTMGYHTGGIVDAVLPPKV